MLGGHRTLPGGQEALPEKLQAAGFGVLPELLLRNLLYVTIIQKQCYSVGIHIVVICIMYVPKRQPSFRLSVSMVPTHIPKGPKCHNTGYM